MYILDYNRHMRLETSMARIHGQPPPPPPHHNQPPPPFRKQDMSARDKSFANNKRHFVDVHHSENHNNNAHNEKPNTRTNLVRINSSDILDGGSDKDTVLNEYPENSQIGHEHAGSVSDIFNDFQPNAMNPINPNMNCSSDSHQDEMKNDDEWENPDEEVGDFWSKHPGHMYPGQSNYGRNRQRAPRGNFRRPPPLLSTPSYMDEHYVSPHNSRGGNNFRRPWGHPRPRRGMW